MDIILIEPTMKYASQIWAFRQEVLDFDDIPNGFSGLNQANDVQEWIDNVRKGNDDQNPLPNRVPASVYLALRQSNCQIIGIVDFRHHMHHPILEKWGGQIGYCVRPSERRKGYASYMLKLVLEKAKAYGLEKVLITCNSDNIASEKVIMKNHGVFESVVHVNDEDIKRFWIKL